MTEIDYSKVAPNYDQADFRAVKETDPILARIVERKECICVLDLACGTGNYIVTNRASDSRVRFVGLDGSAAMLRHAITKEPQVPFLLSDACKPLPFKDQSFDYIVCRFGFHHFRLKHEILEEISSCLKTDGVFYLCDVEPYSNKKWWVHRLFPEIVCEDKKRFWPPGLLIHELQQRHFHVVCRINTGIEVMGKRKLLERLYTRDTSQLHMVSDALFHQRLREVEGWPSNSRLVGDYAFIEVIAQLGGLLRFEDDNSGLFSLTA